MKTGKNKWIIIPVIFIITFLMVSYKALSAKNSDKPIPDGMYDSLGYIISKPDIESRIIGSFEDKQDLSEGDIVYINIGSKKEASPGDRYTVYQLIKTVVHPSTKKEVGHLIRILGFLEIQITRENKSRAIITKSFYPMHKNQPIEKYREISKKPSDAFPEDKLKGYIIASKDQKFELGTQDIIYIDKGSKEGVQPFDIFLILDEKDRGQEPFNPPKGKIVILTVQEQTATAIIEKSSKEIEVGDMLLYEGRSIR